MWTAPNVLLPHELQVAALILIAKERLLPAVSPLNDVMWQARADDTRTEVTLYATY